MAYSANHTDNYRQNMRLRIHHAHARISADERAGRYDGSLLRKSVRAKIAQVHHGASAILRNALTSAPSSLPSMPQRIW